MDTGTPKDGDRLAAQLLPQLDQFLGFARRRLSDPDLAVDAVQDSLLKALRQAGQLRDRDRLVPGFYRILRPTILDLYRRRDVRQRVVEPLPDSLEVAADDPDIRAMCGCLRGLLPTLRSEYAAAIAAADLDEQPLHEVAARLRIQRNTLKVRLHRARRQLRERLLQTCGLCARHACLDCDCGTRLAPGTEAPTGRRGRRDAPGAVGGRPDVGS